MEWNIAFDHDQFWVDKVERAVSAYSGYAQYLYDYELYLLDIENYKEGLEPIIEDLIIYDYIEVEKP